MLASMVLSLVCCEHEGVTACLNCCGYVEATVVPTMLVVQEYFNILGIFILVLCCGHEGATACSNCYHIDRYINYACIYGFVAGVL